MSQPCPETLPLMPIDLENVAPRFVDRENWIVVDVQDPGNLVQHM